MIKIKDGENVKVYRNLPEQVAKNQRDIEDLANQTDTEVEALKGRVTTTEEDIEAIKDGTNIDSFKDVEEALELKADKSTTYTKTETNQLLEERVSKDDIGYIDLGSSTTGTLTDAQYNEVIKKYCIIKGSSGSYYKSSDTDNMIDFLKIQLSTASRPLVSGYYYNQLIHRKIIINKTTKEYNVVDSVITNYYTETQLDDILNNTKLNNQIITLTGTSGTLTDEQEEIIENNVNIIIRRLNSFYYKTTVKATNNNIISFNTIRVYNEKVDNTYYKLVQEYIYINTDTKQWQYLDGKIIELYNKAQIDTLIENAGIYFIDLGNLNTYADDIDTLDNFDDVIISEELYNKLISGRAIIHANLYDNTDYRGIFNTQANIGNAKITTNLLVKTERRFYYIDVNDNEDMCFVSIGQLNDNRYYLLCSTNSRKIID